ncbi:MAG TPA: hypothetical protein VHO25_17015 [Polyangiaceae bacterium]|nr:hypothetical protein [Polyangiaceae bacterium]
MKRSANGHDKDVRVARQRGPATCAPGFAFARGFVRQFIRGGWRTELARLSLGWLLIMPSGCLDSPPSYSKPDQVPPFIIDARVTPDLNAVVQLQAGLAQEFSVPFRSVDVGENLEANVYLDRDPGQPGSWRTTQAVPASQGAWEEDRPPVVFKFRPTSSLDAPGCHTLTFILAHESQWDFVDLEEATPVRLPVDDTRAATVTWWLEIAGDNTSDPARECPRQGSTTP